MSFEDIVKAECVLLNFLRYKDGYQFDETFTIKGITPLQPEMTSRDSRDVLAIRFKFADNFVTSEAVPWQLCQI